VVYREFSRTAIVCIREMKEHWSQLGSGKRPFGCSAQAVEIVDQFISPSLACHAVDLAAILLLLLQTDLCIASGQLVEQRSVRESLSSCEEVSRCWRLWGDRGSCCRTRRAFVRRLQRGTCEKEYDER